MMNNATMPVLEESKELLLTHEGTPLFQRPSIAAVPVTDEDEESMDELFEDDDFEENEIPESPSI